MSNTENPTNDRIINLVRLWSVRHMTDRELIMALRRMREHVAHSFIKKK